MTTRISVPLSKMNDKFIRDLKKKYPGHVRLDIQVVDMDAIPNFSEDDFWKIIDLLDWSQEENDEAILAPAIEFLSKMENAAIYLFHDMLAEKLFLLDKKIYAENLGDDSWGPDQPFSSDNFLYARACVVANGRDFYYQVLANPEKMPKDLTFEALLSLAEKAYYNKTGKVFDYLPTISFETFSNPEGWEQTLWDRIEE